MEHDNRRSDRRFPAVIKVSYGSAGDLRSEYTHNISRGGLFIVTDGAFIKGQVMQLELTCPGIHRAITVPAEVRWVGEKRGQRGIGVQFMMEDPVLRARVDSMVSAVFDPLPPSATGERLNVLLVDPNRHACALFREGLQSMAARRFEIRDYIHVVDTPDGRAALNHLSSGRFALAIVELRTPEVDGLSLIRRVRTEISQSLPVCAISRPFPGDREQALAAGADMFLHKPVQLKALFNTICIMLKLGEPAEEEAA